MLNPTLSQKKEQPLEVNEATKRLFQLIYAEQNSQDEDQESDDKPRIKVSSFVSRMAFYYEKIRNSVDYKEDYLLRKTAIERILKREIVIQGTIAMKKLKSEQIAKHLIVELIRAAYLPNNQIPEDKIGEIARVIDGYIRLRNLCLETVKNSYNLVHIKDEIKERNELTRWTLAMASCDIEERLNNNKIDRLSTKNMYEVLKSKIKLPDGSPYEKDKDIQIYLGIYRNYLKFDEDMLGFILLKYFNADWREYGDETMEKVSRNIHVLRESINWQINHPLVGQMNRLIKRYTVFFTILKDVIDSNPAGVYDNLKNDPKAFPRDIKKICAQKYANANSKLWRAALRSIIYIFLTKSIFVALVEAPATIWLGERINIAILGVNLIFPAFLLFLLVLFTKIPGDDNTAKIISGIEEIAFVNEGKFDQITLREPVKRKSLLNIVFTLIYAATFFLSFGAVVWVLNFTGFNLISIVVFIFFLALVSFFGILIRKGAKELLVIEPKESIFSFFSDFFYVPFMAVGKWLSNKFSKINVFVFILDFIIEAPFKVFVEMAEEWTKYVRERREEIG